MTATALSPAAAHAAAGSPDRMLRPAPAGDSSNHARLFLSMLHRPGCFIELRTLRNGRMNQSFYGTPRMAAAWARSLAPSADVYAGVLPRTQRSGGKDSLAPSRLLFVECDEPMATQRALNYHVPPNMVVRSSPGKAHVYWMLTELVEPKHLEVMCKRLAFHLGADMRATDAARILRVPGTLNHKYASPEWVYLSQFGGDPCDWRDLIRGLPDPKAPARARPVRPRMSNPTAERLKLIPASEYAPFLAGRELHGHLMQCPWHNGGQERTPSLHVRGPNDTLAFCFGCSKGWDIFSFAADTWGMDIQRDFPAVVARLEREFR